MRTFAATSAITIVWLLECVSPAGAANSTFYSDLVSFSAAAGGPLVSQDFSGYAHGTNLRNVVFLPGISVDSNMNSVEAFSAGGISLFGGMGGRENGNAYYDINATLPHRAIAFDITAFDAIAGNNSTAQDSGLLTVFFTDATSAPLSVNGNSTGSNVFFGVVSDTPISKIRWAEAHEGSGGNEETGLDNFYVVRGVVPEPAACSLCAMALAMLLFGRRRWAV